MTLAFWENVVHILGILSALLPFTTLFSLVLIHAHEFKRAQALRLFVSGLQMNLFKMILAQKLSKKKTLKLAERCVWKLNLSPMQQLCC